MSSRQTQSRKRPPTDSASHERVCLLVLGMHRSGTSALTRVISLLGADLPATLLSGSKANLASNAKGHWESEPIVRLNDEILASAGISWRSPEAVPEQWYASVRFDQFRKRALELLEREFGDSPLFVLKDPRTCKLVPFWLSVLDEAGIKPAIVNMVRSPEEVADSLLKRNALDRPLGILMWLRYVLTAERDSRAHNRVHVSFDGLLADWQRSVKPITETFAIRWPSVSTEREGQVSKYLSDSERHHRRSEEPILRDDMNSWATKVCAIINKWVERGESSADHPALDDIADRVTRSIQPLLAALLVSYEKSASVHKLETIRTTQIGELERTKGQLALFDAELAALADEIGMPLPAEASSQGSGDVAFSKRLLGGLAAAIKTQRAQHNEAATALVAKNAELVAIKGELSELGARFESAVAELKLRAIGSEDRLLQESVQRQAAEAKLSQIQRVNATLLIIRGRFEAASEELARIHAKYEDCRKRWSQAERDLVDHERVAIERDRNLKNKLELARKLAKSHEATIIRLREDRAAKIVQRDKLQAAVAAIRDEKTAQIQHRETRIKELSRSVKRLEKKIERLRLVERERERAAASQAAAPLAAPPPPPSATRNFFRFISRSGRGRIRKDIELVKNSDWFDAEYYRARYKDVGGTPDELLEHYVRHGGAEGRAPSAAFDGRRYLSTYPDVAQAGLNPLVHFLESGKDEGRVAVAVDSAKGLTRTDPEALRAEADVPEVTQETSAGESDISEIEVAEVDPRDLPGTADRDTDKASARVAETFEASLVPPQVASFASFANGASDWVRSSEMANIDALKAGAIAVAVDNGSSNSKTTAAVTCFNTLIVESPADAGGDVDSAVRQTLADGRLNVEDAWLSSDYTLQFRLSVDCDDPLIARCCQLTEDGNVSLCAEQSLVARQSNIVETRLVSRFAAVLLVLTDRRGGLVDSTLLPFPTLVRGGLHHGELINHDGSLTGWAAHEAYASKLLTAITDKSHDYAVAGISVALADANGTEPVFSTSFRQWLSRQFNVAVKAAGEGKGDNPASRNLAEQMRAIEIQNTAPRRSAGRTLLLGSDAIPSLGVLLATDAELAKASALRTIVVDGLSRRPLRAVDHPIIDCGDITLLQQAFEPALAPEPARDSGPAVVSISFSDDTLSDVRAPFPVAGDIISAIPGLVPLDNEAISAVIVCTGDKDGLARLLTSLARQQFVLAVECLLTGDVPEMPEDSVALVQAERRLTLVRVEAAEATAALQLRAALEQATHHRIMLLDDKKVLHDPRTLAVLGALSAREEIGTAGCQIVSDGGKKGGIATYRTRTSYAPLWREDNPVVVTCPYAGDLDRAALYPVLANPIACLMARRDILSSLLDELERSDIDGSPSIVLGRAVIERGLLNIATSLIAIADGDDMRAANVAAPWLAATATRFIAIEEF